MEVLDRQSEQPRQDFYDGFYVGSEFINRAHLESEAWLLINNRQNRKPAAVRPQERRDNARTALMEALTASGHLSRIEIRGTLDDINHQVLSRLLSGWDDELPWYEKQRRFAELCNELFIQKVHTTIAKGGLDQTTSVLENSDYPEGLDDNTAQSLGYRASNQKGMVRSTHLIDNGDGTYIRVIEQGSRANGTSQTSLRFMAAAGAIVNHDKPTDIAILETPLVYSTKNFVDGVVDIMRMLDQQAGPGVMYGDTGARTFRHVPYEDLRVESLRRETEIEMYIDDLAALEQQLDELKATGAITRDDQLRLFKEEVDRILTAICTLEPDYALDTFGEEAAPHFYEASAHYAQGYADKAQAVLETAHYLKEAVTFCGMELTIKDTQKQGLKVNSFQDLLEKGRINWRWKQGLCQVKECPSRPKKTEVGPCSVCRSCQKIFDKGGDPTKTYAAGGFLKGILGL